MPDAEALYDVRERTGNPEHASVADVVELVVARVQNPRDDHEDAHFDAAMAAVVDRYGMEPVGTVIHRVLVDYDTFRTATNDLEMRTIDGIRIGTTASRFLEELSAQGND